MGAKSRAEFINSVAQGQVVPCPVCGAQINPQNRFCLSCGAKMAAEPINKTPAFAPAPVDVGQPPVSEQVQAQEEKSLFAEGLPSWDVVPPETMVRRRSAK